MRHIAFAALAICASGAAAQARQIPGRDLLSFPIGLAAEAAPLSDQAGAGLWNPATALLPGGARWRVSAIAMNSSADDIGVSAQGLAIGHAVNGTSIGITVARVQVANLTRTDADPLSIGSELSYSTLVVSALAARRFTSHVTAGVALRRREGRLDNVTSAGITGDVGVLVEHLGFRDARIGASTFLFSPGAGSRERTSYLVGGDVRVVGPDSGHAVRVGYALEAAAGLSSEHYLFAAARWDRWEARGGPVRTEVFGGSNVRVRLGLALHHHGYAFGVAREESAGGLAPTYQFSLTSVRP
jgi:hypothetical protein